MVPLRNSESLPGNRLPPRVRRHVKQYPSLLFDRLMIGNYLTVTLNLHPQESTSGELKRT